MSGKTSHYGSPAAGQVSLRPATSADGETIFAIQSDPESNDLAGTKERTREAFFANWQRVLAEPKINFRIIEVDGVIVGGISVFQAEGRDNMGYWIARSQWGRGITSRAAALFLSGEPRRPLHATAASSNTASLRILEKCGFRLVKCSMCEETERYVAREVAEFVLE